MNDEKKWEDAVASILFDGVQAADVASARRPKPSSGLDPPSPPRGGKGGGSPPRPVSQKGGEGFFKKVLRILSSGGKTDPIPHSRKMPKEEFKVSPVHRRAARAFRGDGHIVSTEGEFLSYLAQSLFESQSGEARAKGGEVLLALSREGAVQRFTVKETPMVYFKK